MIVEPFKPYHIDLMRAQGVQGAQLAEVSLVPLGTLIKPPGPALTVFDANRVLLCGGIIPKFPGRGECWALLSAESGRHLLWLTRAIQRFTTMQQWRRLEATAEEGFGAGCRWLELLGFSYEGTMRNYGLNGETHLRYARTD